MPYIQEFHLTFRYGKDEFSLVKDADSTHPVKINGVTYDVLGNAGELDDVCKLLSSLPLESVLSENDLKERLSSVSGISFPSAEGTKGISEKHLGTRPKETEDVKKARPQLKRTLSAHQMGRAADQPTEAEEIAKKSGELWECVKRRPDRSNGYIYIFKLKDEYDDLTVGKDSEQRLEAAKQKRAEIYPATESFGHEVTYLDPKVTEDEYVSQLVKFKQKETYAKAGGSPSIILTEEENIRGNGKKVYAEASFLRQLGYKVEQRTDGVFLHLPDKEALLSHWEALQETFPRLPPLDIISSKGVADDLSFFEAYFIHDALLSEGREFSHDHLVHILAIISIIKNLSLMSDDQEHLKKKWQIMKVAMSGYRKLLILKKEIADGELKIPQERLRPIKAHLDQIALSLSAYVDSITTIGGYEMLRTYATNGYLEGMFQRMPFSSDWSSYLKKRGFDDVMDIIRFGELWDEMVAVEKEFDRQRKKTEKT